MKNFYAAFLILGCLFSVTYVQAVNESNEQMKRNDNKALCACGCGCHAPCDCGCMEGKACNCNPRR